MMLNTHPDPSIITIGFLAVLSISHEAVNDILQTAFLAVSILFVLYKWAKDLKKDKQD